MLAFLAFQDNKHKSIYVSALHGAAGNARNAGHYRALAFLAFQEKVKCQKCQLDQTGLFSKLGTLKLTVSNNDQVARLNGLRNQACYCGFAKVL